MKEGRHERAAQGLPDPTLFDVLPCGVAVHSLAKGKGGRGPAITTSFTDGGEKFPATINGEIQRKIAQEMNPERFYFGARDGTRTHTA